MHLLASLLVNLIFLTFGQPHLSTFHTFRNISSLEQLLPSVNISEGCRGAFSTYFQGLRGDEPWALMMMDSGADFPPSGLLEGNFVDLGNFDECIGVSSNNSPLEGKYCLVTTTVALRGRRRRSVVNPYSVHYNNLDTNADLQLGQCFPSNCTSDDLQSLLGKDIKLNEELCQTKQSRNFGNSAIVATCFFISLLLLVIASTCYEAVLFYIGKEPHHQILLAFALLTNFNKLMRIGGKKDITCLHGMKVVSMMWILLCHVNSIQYHFPVRNSFVYFQWINNESNMYLMSANLAVDTFFFISGLLIVYMFMGNVTKGHKFNAVLHYVHRYLRLTPVLAVLVLFHATLLGHVGSGPLWPAVTKRHLIEGCKVNWWKTLLYVQNVFGRGKPMCVPHSWYLSTDMQLFLVSPILLLPLKKYPKLGLFILGSLVFWSMVTCFCIGWFFELNANEHANLSFQKQMDFVWYYYFPIHTRAAPWLIGMIMGYLVHAARKEELKLPFNKLTVMFGWTVCLTILCSCVFCGHSLSTGPYNRLVNSFEIALVRPLWTLGISWVVLACDRGFGGPIHGFLSLSIFHVLSKLTYTLYLTHYAVIYIIRAQMRATEKIDDFQVMYKFWGDFACSFIVSAILTLTVEFPVVTVEQWIFNRRAT